MKFVLLFSLDNTFEEALKFWEKQVYHFVVLLIYINHHYADVHCVLMQCHVCYLGAKTSWNTKVMGSDNTRTEGTVKTLSVMIYVRYLNIG